MLNCLASTFAFLRMTLSILDKRSDVFGSRFYQLLGMSFLVESTVLPVALSLSYNVNLCQIGLRAIGSHRFNDWHVPDSPRTIPIIYGWTRQNVQKYAIIG